MAKKINDPTGLNTSRYYASQTRSVIGKKHFSERRGKAGDALPPPKPAMVFKSEDSNANKYYQEGYGQHLRKAGQPVAKAAPAVRPRPVATVPPPPPVVPVPVAAVPPPASLADQAAKLVTKAAAKAAARVKPVETPVKPPVKPTLDAITLVAGEQLMPVVSLVIKRLNQDEKVTVTSKSKTLMKDFDAVLGEAVSSHKVDALKVSSQLIRKLDGKKLQPLAFAIDEGDDAPLPEMTVDEMKSVVTAPDPEKRIAELAAVEPETDDKEESYFGDADDEMDT